LKIYLNTHRPNLLPPAFIFAICGQGFSHVNFPITLGVMLITEIRGQRPHNVIRERVDAPQEQEQKSREQGRQALSVLVGKLCALIPSPQEVALVQIGDP
jgi:hypothetical protein